MSKSEPQPTVESVLRDGAAFLARKNIEHPRIACELLLARLLNRPRLSLHLVGDQSLQEHYLEAMRRGIRRVAAGEPVQYVIGQTEFMGHVFKTDARALIPRPETETLVHRVLEDKALWARHHPVIADLGTGTGCIVLSLAKAMPEARYIGLDPSAAALELATENRQVLGLQEQVALAEGDLADAIEPAMLDALVANLPYVATADWEALPVHIRDHEPRVALDGGPDGLHVIEQAVQDAVMVLKPQGRLFLEIGADQGARVTALLRDTGFSDTGIQSDLAGRDRVAFGVWPG